MISFLPLIEKEKNFIVNCRKEMICFSNSLNEIPKSFDLPIGITPVSGYDPSVRFVNNKLYGEISEDDFFVSFAYELIIKLLNDYFKTGKRFNLEVENVFNHSGEVNQQVCIKNRVKIINYVRNLIRQEDFYLSNAPRVVRKVARSLKSETDSDYNSLIQSFNLKAHIPDKFTVEGSSIAFTEKELKVVQFFVDSKDNANFLIDHLIEKTSVENVVFGRPFRDICTSNPRSIYRTVQASFDLVKNKGENFINSLLGELRLNLQKFRTQFSQEVLPKGGTEKATGNLTFDRVRSYLDDIEKEKFFIDLFANSYLTVNDLTEESFALMSGLYDVVHGLDILGLNDFFGLDYTQSEWNDFISRLNKIGICGINLFSMDLFRFSLESLTFISDSKIYRTVEEIEEFNLVLENVGALISTIKPIGTPL